MRGLLSNFSLALRLAVVGATLTVGWAAVVGVRLHRAGRPFLAAVARMTAIGSAFVAVAATSVVGSRLVFERGGDLVLTPGGAGLGNLDQVLAAPTSLAAVLLVSNVLLYVPIAFTAVIGWYERRRFVLPACLALSMAVETIQYLFLGRVAALDDVLLNTAGAAVGFAGAALAVRSGLVRLAPVTAP